MDGHDHAGQRATVFVEPYEVDLELSRRIGLSRGVLESVARQLLAESRRTTVDDADGADGYYAWTRGLRVLRVESRMEAGWHREKLAGIPATFNAEETVAIAVSSGDEYTGIDGDKDPSTKNVKGPASIVAIDGNVLRHGDFAPFDAPAPDFWYFLFFIDGDDVRIELSMPTFRDASGKISSWKYRIVIGTVAPEGDAPISRKPIGNAGDDSGVVVDVPVQRKSA